MQLITSQKINSHTKEAQGVAQFTQDFWAPFQFTDTRDESPACFGVLHTSDYSEPLA